MSRPKVDAMPDRGYISLFTPPRRVDRLAFHILEVMIAVYSVVRGSLRIFDSLFPGRITTVDPLPGIPAYAISVGLIVGGVVWLHSILQTFETVNGYYFSLRTGLSTIGISWTAFFASAIILKPDLVATWFLALCITGGTGALYFQSFHNERATRKR